MRSTSTSRGSTRPARSRCDEDVRTELAHVFPSLTARRERQQAGVQHERYRSHRAVRALLERLAATQAAGARARRPPLGRRGVRRAARRAAAPAAGGARADRRWPPPAPACRSVLSAALERAHRAEALTRIELDALTPDEARELLGDAVERRRASALYEESGGNPFYLEQLARSLDRAARRRRDDEPSLAGSASRRPSPRRSPRSWRCCRAGRAPRAGGRGGGGRSVRARAGRSRRRDIARPRRWTAIDELLQLDLLRPTDVPRRFRFRHPLVRRAVYEAHRRRLAAGRARAVRRGARGAGRNGCGARASRRALGARGRRRRRAVLREAGEEAVRAGAGKRRALVRRGAAPARRRPRRRRSASSFSSPVQRALTAAGRFDDSHSALLDALAIVPARLPRARVPGSPAPVPEWRASSDARSKPATAWRAPSAPARPGLARGGGAHDRARP